MPKRRYYKINNIYHIYNRGVDKRNIFLDRRDYKRFINNIFIYNDENIKCRNLNNSYHFNKTRKNKLKTRKIIEIEEDNSRDIFVEVLSFCLMPNHFHFILRPKKSDGIQKFLQKLCAGYSLYFNERYSRSGSLFQGRYKDVPIEDEKHFNWIPYYIHCNPLDLKFPGWRKGNLKSIKEAIKFLDFYEWSSHLSYLENKHLAPMIHKEFLREDLGLGDEYLNNFRDWLSNKKSFDSVNEELILESKHG
ncbi:MAG: transposase [Candidatus Paceibacterota bacterium]